MLEMETRLQQEGLCSEVSSDSERLDRLWRLFVKKENSVRMLTRELEELRAKHAAEIDMVQLYIQNIRSLSKTRDSMALELERENETLHSNLTELNLQQEAQKSEIAEMLVQEGLAEIMTSSLSEQVAYLLADRAALMEKIQALEDGDSKTLNVKCTQRQRAPDENVAPLQAQSPWKRLLGFRKAAQAKQGFTHNDNQANEDNTSKARERSLLERDLDEASTRLNLAHKEIRRLTDELESAHLTKRTYESELHGAQVEAEQLRREVEKLKRCDLAEVQAIKEMKEVLDAEVRHLRDSVHTMHAERAQLLELIDRNFKELDSEDEDFIRALTRKLTPTRRTRKKQKDAHKRCPEELDEGLSSLQELNQVVVKLQADLEQETELRNKVEEEECNDERRRKEAEQQTLEHQDKDHNAKVQHLQQKLVALHAQLEQLKSVLTEEQRRDLAMKVQNNTQSAQDVLKTTLQEQENLKLRQDAERLEEFCERLQTELQQVHCNLHVHVRKYDELKVRHREKLAEAKQVYLREMTWRDQKMKEQERELDILTKRLKKESEMVKMVTAENEALLQTKKTLLCQLNEAEENRKNAAAKISALQRRVDFLEKDSMQQWEMNMEKSTQIAKLERRLWDVESLKSTRVDIRMALIGETVEGFHVIHYLQKHDGSRILEDRKEAGLSESGFETSIISKTRDELAEKLGLSASPSSSSGSEMGYMNIFTHNLA
ncbi:trichohyalin isoform X2 [Pangasianodon hypophthalmus]|nr:trichohyalin isoform X2 [Pangasianodon hypophthalmus]XP_053082946.1 trichohyalin isoform X2 [Pangasianodon hypophthalmus]